jgi:hypothetical protein
MKVMNIGIIIRNDHDDTFPVALTPQMVSIIQNLLTQIPAMNSKIVDAKGKPVIADASIPIIPRRVEFDWDTAYAPIMPEEEQKMMKELREQYAVAETEEVDKDKAGGIIVPEGMDKADDPDNKVTKLKPAIGTDKNNPFNLELDASGTANADLEKKGYTTEPDPKACVDKVGIGSDKMEEIRADDKETAGAEPTADEAKAAGAELDKQASVEDLETTAIGKGDCTVTPDSLELNGEQENI